MEVAGRQSARLEGGTVRREVLAILTAESIDDVAVVLLEFRDAGELNGAATDCTVVWRISEIAILIDVAGFEVLTAVRIVRCVASVRRLGVGDQLFDILRKVLDSRRQ